MSRHPSVPSFPRSLSTAAFLILLLVACGGPTLSPPPSNAPSPLCGSPAAEALLGPNEVRPPTITPTDGLDGCVRVDRLGAREALAIELAP